MIFQNHLKILDSLTYLRIVFIFANFPQLLSVTECIVSVGLLEVVDPPSPPTCLDVQIQQTSSAQRRLDRITGPPVQWPATAKRFAKRKVLIKKHPSYILSSNEIRINLVFSDGNFCKFKSFDFVHKWETAQCNPGLVSVSVKTWKLKQHTATDVVMLTEFETAADIISININDPHFRY